MTSRTAALHLHSLILLCIGCGPDRDHDGWADPADCEPERYSIHPGADDLTQDGIDQDCDGVDGTDLDGDGQASLRSGGADCDDQDATVYAGAEDICLNGVREDCDKRDALPGPHKRFSRPLTLSEQSLLLPGLEAYGFHGRSASGAGDADGDGVAGDVLIGAFKVDGSATDSGAAYLYSAVDLRQGIASPRTTIVGENAHDLAGFAVAGLGDVNGDGTDDLLISAHASSMAAEGAGAVYLILGPVTGAQLDLANAPVKLLGQDRSMNVGSHLASAGDFNGDGLQDLAVDSVSGIRSYGDVAVLLGSEDWHPDDPLTIGFSEAELSIRGDLSWRESGAWFALASAGDINGDGLDDLLVGATKSDKCREAAWAGAAALFLGDERAGGLLSWRDAALRMEGVSPGDCAGSAVAAGDLDGDGWPELVIGAERVHRDDPKQYNGAVYVVDLEEEGMNTEGPLAMTLDDATATWYGEPGDGSASALPGDAAGKSIAAVRRCDERADLLIGRPKGGVDSEGAASLVTYSGPGTFNLTDRGVDLLGNTGSSETGNHVASAGDVDGDGWEDLLIGAHQLRGDLDGDGSFGDNAVGGAYLLLTGP
ncbi:MAG: FG-GAP repeat protein [Alphaproteobacteria bacterium]|nr:FG-GAP repeat protein [Alphaproteobacteria bacterium]